MKNPLPLGQALAEGDTISASVSEDVRFGRRKVYISVRAEIHRLPGEEAELTMRRLESALVRARDSVILAVDDDLERISK